jgi:hypothetical protein
MNSMTKGSALSSFVMAGLVPAIHVFASHCVARPGRLDARNKSGHDVTGYSVTEGPQGRSGR